MRYIFFAIILLITGCTERSKQQQVAYRSYIKRAIAIDSLSGRGKYFVFNLDSTTTCSSIRIVENKREKRVKSCKVEYFEKNQWRTLHNSEVFKSPLNVYFKPTKSKLFRVHITKAESLPNIALITLFE